jgi:hypothetical protein
MRNQRPVIAKPRDGFAARRVGGQPALAEILQTHRAYPGDGLSAKGVMAGVGGRRTAKDGRENDSGEKG